MVKRMNDALDPILQSIIRIELLTFFQANPHTRDTVEGLALRLHRPRYQVETALQKLIALGILETGGTRRFTIYRLHNGDLISSYFQEQCGGKISGPRFR